MKIFFSFRECGFVLILKDISFGVSAIVESKSFCSYNNIHWTGIEYLKFHNNGRESSLVVRNGVCKKYWIQYLFSTAV